VDGEKHGYGSYSYAYGDKYTGEWKDGEKRYILIFDLYLLLSGNGTIEYQNGTKLDS
jgi:hypothetical protein